MPVHVSRVTTPSDVAQTLEYVLVSHAADARHHEGGGSELQPSQLPPCYAAPSAASCLPANMQQTVTAGDAHNLSLIRDREPEILATGFTCTGLLLLGQQTA